MSPTEVIRREWGNVVMTLLAILAVVLGNRYDFLRMSEYWGQEIGLTIYGLLTIMLWVLVAITYEWLYVSTRIKIVTADSEYANFSSPFFEGRRYYAVLGVQIPKTWEITECYVNIDKIVPIYYRDRELIDSEFAAWVADKTHPEYRRLIWKSKFASENCKITIGDNSNLEFFYVGQISSGILRSEGKEIPFDSFEFSLCSNKPNTISFKQFGLYKIELSVHWKKNGNRMIPKKFSGYIYSRETPGAIVVRPGDYKKDTYIPSPAFEKNKSETQEEPTS